MQKQSVYAQPQPGCVTFACENFALLSHCVASSRLRFDCFLLMFLHNSPGTYDVEHLYGNMNQPTFNITIAEEMYK